MAASTRRYILDTNVLLYDPDALLAFPDGEVIVPITVIEEIDTFKKEMSETGRNARLVSNAIDAYRRQGNLSQGVVLDNGSRFVVHAWRLGSDVVLPAELDMRRSGNRVLAAAVDLSRQGGAVVLVSQDTNIRIKANALGIEATAYEGSAPGTVELYEGFQRKRVTADELHRCRGMQRLELEGRFHPNEGVLMETGEPADGYALFRQHPGERVLLPIHDFSEGIWDVRPRNPQQALALELLMDPAVSIVTLMGMAGTGKTLLALAAGLQMMMEENTYTKLLVSRPIFPMGKDIGYLPGTAQEKLEPWMQPIFDNLEFLIGSPVSKSHPVKGYQALIDQGLVNIEPLTYIRGRSIPNQFMIVDEAQNLTPHEIKTIITRVGVGTKIVLTGDPYQIDNPYVDAISNGLSHVVEKFRSQPLAGHVTLMRGERSPLAELAANLL